MIRRIIRLLIILGLAYGIYRWIDPVGAEALVATIQSYFDKEKESELVIEQESQDAIVTEEDLSEEVVKAPVYTGAIDTWSSVELDYVLSESTQTTWSQSTTTTTPTVQSTTTTTATQSTPPAPKPTTTTSKKSLSSQDEADMKAFLNAIVE